ncbi:MAG TPA: orotate phosphoribosyltransferase [Clostridia bacterium]|nr:orotate phosphoribosyltransferase [Clostridia bacterium]
MNKDSVIDIFTRTGAVMKGHFLLTSGLHSDTYIQCARVLQYPEHTAQLVAIIASAFKDERIDLVVGPAVGGILVAYEAGRQLGVPALFTEREGGAMTLRRGFEIPAGARVLVVEDVVTTGGSVMEVMKVVSKRGAQVAGIGLLVDRSGGRIDFGVKKQAVLTLDVKTYSPEDCPLCRQGMTAVKPGSRGLK